MGPATVRRWTQTLNEQVSLLQSEDEPAVKRRLAPVVEELSALARDMEQAAGQCHAAEAQAAPLAAVENMTTDAIIGIDAQQRIVLFNRGAERVFGYPASEMLGQTIERLVPEPCRSSHGRDISAWAMQAHAPRTMTRNGEAIRALRADGTECWLDASISKVDVGGQTLFMVVLRDVTERRKLERQLLHAQRMESVGRLAGGVAHDFNNLLTAIIGYANFAREGLPEGEPARADIDAVLRAASRAAALTRQLLAFSRRQMLDVQPINVNDLILGLDRMLRRMLGEDIELATVLDPHLQLVQGDPSQIEQVLINLAVNARDAMPAGGKITIQTSNVTLDDDFVRRHQGAKAGPFVLISFSDTGCGMSEEVKAHLFEPFFTTKQPGKGTGLGLATVYGIIKQHEGNIWAESEEGQGTTFRIYLPRLVGAKVEFLPPDPPAGSLRGDETVLIAEDEPTVRELAGRALGELGYRVLLASNGAEALRVAR